MATDKEKIKALKRKITIIEKVLHEKNLELDAMHYVWCNGGCHGGMHRWCNEKHITEDLVKRAEVNVKRLRTWYNNYEGRKEWDTCETDEERKELFSKWYPDKLNPYSEEYAEKWSKAVKTE